MYKSKTIKRKKVKSHICNFINNKDLGIRLTNVTTVKRKNIQGTRKWYNNQKLECVYQGGSLRRQNGWENWIHWWREVDKLEIISFQLKII